MDGKLMRIKEVAAKLAVSVRTVYRLINSHELTRVHVRGCACIAEADVAAYIERHTRKETV